MATDCKGPAGALRPQIDRNKCEGKEDCLRVCPYDVFTIGVLPVEDRKSLSIIGRLKGFGHGYKQAFVTKPNECHNCGLCVTACPEKAIKLVPVASR